MRYRFNTNLGEQSVEAATEYEARTALTNAGYTILGPGSPTDNAGDLSVDVDGGVGIGLGGGLVMESDGDLGIQIAPGISMDL